VYVGAEQTDLEIPRCSSEGCFKRRPQRASWTQRTAAAHWRKQGNMNYIREAVNLLRLILVAGLVQNFKFCLYCSIILFLHEVW